IFGVPHLAVQEPHERAVSIAVDLREILGRGAPHWRHCLKSLTSVASSPDAHSVLPPAAILMLVRRPATRTAGSSVAGCTSSGSAQIGRASGRERGEGGGGAGGACEGGEEAVATR